jgi:hypothetical protein
MYWLKPVPFENESFTSAWVYPVLFRAEGFFLIKNSVQQFLPLGTAVLDLL